MLLLSDEECNLVDNITQSKQCLDERARHERAQQLVQGIVVMSAEQGKQVHDTMIRLYTMNFIRNRHDKTRL